MSTILVPAVVCPHDGGLYSISGNTAMRAMPGAIKAEIMVVGDEQALTARQLRDWAEMFPRERAFCAWVARN